MLLTFLVITVSVAYWYGRRVPAASATPADPARPLPHDTPAALVVSSAAAPAKFASSSSPPPVSSRRCLQCEATEKTSVRAKAANLAAMLRGGLDVSKFAEGVSPNSANLAPMRALHAPTTTTGEVDTSPPMMGEEDNLRGRRAKDLRKDKVFKGKLKRVMLAGGPFARPKAEECVDTISVTPPSAQHMAEPCQKTTMGRSTRSLAHRARPGIFP